MIKNKKHLILFLLLYTSISCEDFQEMDISKIKVQLDAPSNNLQTALSNITFWWDSIDNVQKYNIRVVSKSFNNLETIILDTTVKKTKIIKQLAAGEFEWRVCAINGDNKAYSDTFKFVIQSK
jgi:hypothetical protein